MVKLHIYGCSHSTAYQVDQNDFWANKLAKLLDINIPNQEGLSGYSYQHIFSLILNDIYTNTISKDDIVILNTSYENRYTVPFTLFKNKNETHILKTDYRPNNNESHKIHNGIRVPIDIEDLVISNIIFDESEIIIDWYNKTKLSYDLLSNVCDNVYQWTLSPIEDIEILNDISSNYLEFVSDKSNLFLSKKLFNKNKSNKIKNEWKNLLEPPHDYKCWNDFIKLNSISEVDLHMNQLGHEKFSNEMFTQINIIK